jgi:LmbE family N-acetylglucosaminyl deacetylase
MNSSPFQFTRLEDGKKLRTTELRELMRGAEDLSKETWLFVSPHDDDLAIGAGLWLQAAVRAGVRVEVLVVTDGSQGYCTLAQKDKIVEIRLAETIESFEILGVAPRHVHSIGYPDGGLTAYLGRRPATSSVEVSIGGHVGLQNAFTYYLRTLRPHRVFVPTPMDLHPDHQQTNNELMISLFHASGAIWPELGEPLTEFPKPYELAIYCDFAEPPNLEIHASDEILETKLKSIAAYQSQAQIAGLIESARKAGAFEYLREIAFKLYSAECHRARFA